MDIHALGAAPPPTSSGANARAQPSQAAPAAPANGSAKSKAEEARSLSPEQLEAAVDELRKQVEPLAQNLLLAIDKETGRTIVKLVDTATNKVLRQIPSEQILDLIHSVGKAQGKLIQGKA
ncbi:MAG: flagellar protein FlaG [Rhodocyclaceae bacterium]|nr:flagellar protein FlaG [Rhodocyclaceae bacterium]MBX3668627.1 flagellar protein FlaG [Rhodocyclaceae bacterium]